MTEISSYTFPQVTEIELVYKSKQAYNQRPKITCAEDAAALLKGLWDQNKIELLEQVKILLLDRNMNCIGVADIATGGISGSIVDPRIIYATALKARATSFILAHNHPSGNLSPSEADRRITERLLEGGRFLDITLNDHLIISKDGFPSYSNTWDHYPAIR